MFSISEFKSNIDQKGVLQNNRFIVDFGLPEYLKLDRGYEDVDLVSLRCEAASIPGVSITTIDMPRIGFGPLEYQAHNFTQDDIVLTFLVDAHGSIPKLFYDWLNTIVNFQVSKGHDGLNRVVGLSGIEKAYTSGPYEVGFKDDYSVNLNITVYDKDARQQTSSVQIGDLQGPSTTRTLDIGTRVMKLTAYKAYPKAMSSIDMAWVNDSELMRLQIPFAYTDFSIEYFRDTRTFASNIAVTQEGTNFEEYDFTSGKEVRPTPRPNIPDIADINLANTTPSEARQQVSDTARQRANDPALPDNVRDAYRTVSRDYSGLGGRKI